MQYSFFAQKRKDLHVLLDMPSRNGPHHRCGSALRCLPAPASPHACHLASLLAGLGRRRGVRPHTGGKARASPRPPARARTPRRARHRQNAGGRRPASRGARRRARGASTPATGTPDASRRAVRDSSHRVLPVWISPVSKYSIALMPPPSAATSRPPGRGFRPASRPCSHLIIRQRGRAAHPAGVFRFARCGPAVAACINSGARCMPFAGEGNAGIGFFN